MRPMFHQLKHIFALILLLFSFVQQTLQQETCSENVDLVFALDVSGTVEESGFLQIKKFASDVIQNFEIGTDKTHVGVVTFSEKAEVQIRLTETFNKEELLKRIDNLDYDGRRTATDDALRIVNSDMFSLYGGTRQGVAQVLILLTDSVCTVCSESLALAVEPLEERGVNIYTIGVTDKINRNELEVIASEPYDEHVFEVDRFDQLSSLSAQLFRKSCDSKRGKCPKPLSPFDCLGFEEDICIADGECPGEQKCCNQGCFRNCTYPVLNCLTSIDIALALDSSNSVKENAFVEMKQFVNKIIDSFQVSQLKTRFTGMTYSREAEINFNFVQYDTAAQIKKAIQNMPHKKSDTRVDKVLELASTNVFSLEGKVRSRNPMVLILFFDGDVSRDMRDLADVVAPLKASGVKIIVIGVGPEINLYQLKKVASSETTIFQGTKFNDLFPQIYRITKEICSDKSPKGGCDVTLEADCTKSIAVDKCQSDFDCYGNGKCCKGKDGCSRKCVYKENICKRNVDIAFALHENIDQYEFEASKHFLKHTMGLFEIGPVKTHTALLTFGKESKVVFDFNTVQDLEQNLKPAINAVKLVAGRGSLLDALILACEKIFCQAHGTRDSVPKMLVMITGQAKPSDSSELQKRISFLRSRGVDVITIGVGDVDTVEMQRITSDDKSIENKVLLSRDFAGILRHSRDISDYACGEAGSIIVPSGNCTNCEPPKTCVKGMKGSRGRPGPIGEKGFDGILGPVGAKGLKGPRGYVGNDGERGDRGEQGQKGVIGLPGHKGFSGLPGHPGQDGLIGYDGDCGIPGKAGDAGIPGINGFPGPPGFIGMHGLKGEKGKPAKYDPKLKIYRGLDGDPGLNGKDGRKGEMGDDGMNGAPGDDGENGDFGFPGIDGEKGDPAINADKRKGEKGGLGEAGLAGKDCDCGNITGQIKGLGASGEPGPDGAKGERGEPGKDSIRNGIQGERGEQGPQGDKGMIGRPGEKGLSGLKGELGSVGEKGEAGERGAEGFPGTRGINGEVGLKGRPGNVGRHGDSVESVPGVKGHRGEQGDKGVQGSQGEDGAVGPEGDKGPGGDFRNGPTGDQGSVGGRGKSGSDGIPGVDGIVGEAGIKGETGSMGPKGDSGVNGKIIPGTPGFEGERGLNGSKGATGHPGPPGQPGKNTTVICIEGKCPKGSKGAQGAYGRTGETGETGISGRPGSKGIPGGPCPTCPVGDRGQPGDQGNIGKAGLNGRAGSDGDPGEAGKKGTKGVSGPGGDKGLKGINGIKGEEGKRGSKGKPGPGDVTVAPIGLKGLPGDDGEPGRRGETGLKGEPGRFGAVGSRGRRGKEGKKGLVGSTGEIAAHGKDGEQGKSGDRGDDAKGQKGDPGAGGEEGEIGFSGRPGRKGKKGGPGDEPTEEVKQRLKEIAPGDVGPTGESGEPGEIGIRGFGGPKGERGPKGYQGVKGKPGPSAEKGDIGEKGRVGNDGDPGSSGFPGRFGARGASGEPGKAGKPGEDGLKGMKGDIGDDGPDGARGLDGDVTAGCIGNAIFDIAFLIDSSRSVNEEDFQRQKDFIRNILGQFSIGEGGSQAAIIKYGENAQVEFRFNDYNTADALLGAVDRLRHNKADESRLDVALKLARDELFIERNGARLNDVNVKQALVILGDGFISGGEMLSHELSKTAISYTDQLKNEGVLVFSLAVGAEKNSNLLQIFVSSPKFYLTVPKYSVLFERIGELKNYIALESVGNCQTSKGEPASKNGSSGEIGEKGFKGTRGKQGDQGPIGFNGFFGIKGYKGESGTGIEGQLGSKGPKGMKGDSGLPGIQGERSRGKDGLKGPKGFPAEGDKGFKGIKGEQGDQGFAGPKGEDSQQKLCDVVLATDIIFLLDSSSGVGVEEFEKMKTFVKSIVTSFDVDNLLTRVAVITYDSNARVDITFSDHKSQEPLLKSIEALRYEGGESTRIDLALRKAAEIAFSGSGRDRRKAIVLMTDGQQSYAKDMVGLPEAVKPFVDAKTLRYAIGIGSEISKYDLSVIAGDNVVLADDFDNLLMKIEDQISLIARLGCKGDDGFPGKQGPPGDDGFVGEMGEPGVSGKPGKGGPKGPKGVKGASGDSQGTGNKGLKGMMGDGGPRGLPGCNEIGRVQGATDLGFILDASASLYAEGFEDEIKFIRNVIDAVGPITPNGLRAGVIVYSAVANIRIKLDDNFNSVNFKNAVQNIPYDNEGVTRIDLGFEKAKELFTLENGARPSSKKVLVLLTDGQQSYVPNTKDPIDIANELKEDGIEIFSVGIGAEIDSRELESFTSKPEYLFLASNQEALIGKLVDEISQALTCEGGPRGMDGQHGDDGPPGARGSKGKRGEVGMKGMQGEDGSGPRGDRGDDGNKGRIGDTGDKGFRGPMGKRGVRGFIGDNGIPGEAGMKGDFGPPGAAGPKGEKGDTRGDGGRGERGPDGDFGPKGLQGDTGVLPSGNVIGDWKGDVGEPGVPGKEGDKGKKGQLFSAPGETGLGGLKGEKGESGLIGEEGAKGLRGPQGPKGDLGMVGGEGFGGDKGAPGLLGERGRKGDRGVAGVRRNGDKGDKGKIGMIGDPGLEGLPGFIGFIGRDGEKGEKGDRGIPGRQQLPDPNKIRESKGLRGDKGQIGDHGYTGDPGEPGIVVAGSRGVKGEKGMRGDDGDKGPNGFSGFIGRIGLKGQRGLKGRAGPDGDPGSDGPPGMVGDMGPILGGGSMGEMGDVGLKGLRGRPGTKGSPGLTGEEGRRGPSGQKGQPGSPGFAGLSGEDGKTGKPGPKGENGDQGPAGSAGLPGPLGTSAIASDLGYTVVRHSQTAFIPSCPRSYKVLWEGYSLMYTVGNGHAHSQDLGDPGSCSKSFSTLPFLFCDITRNCKYASRNDFTYWLSGDVQQPMMPVSNSAIEPFISRCVVCEAQDSSMTVHSQDVSIPGCPTGYSSLWTGYSFMMVAAAGKSGAGQSLSSSGSCLEKFRPKPFIECQGERGTCHFFPDKFSFWLSSVDPSKQFEVQQSATLDSNKGDDLTSRVSKCRVCMRMASEGNAVESGLIRRVARNIRKWFF